MERWRGGEEERRAGARAWARVQGRAQAGRRSDGIGESGPGSAYHVFVRVCGAFVHAGMRAAGLPGGRPCVHVSAAACLRASWYASSAHYMKHACMHVRPPARTHTCMHVHVHARTHGSAGRFFCLMSAGCSAYLDRAPSVSDI